MAHIYKETKRSLKVYHRELGECLPKMIDTLLADKKAYDKLTKSTPKAERREPKAND